MNVILIMVHFMNVYLWVVFTHLHKFPFHILEQSLVEYLPTVFGRKNKMVITKIHAMTGPSIFHASTLPNSSGFGY